ncbi:MAG: hypothetical protein JO278_11100, partial [Dyella sp.]|nr:hypothetical protein [Dyella sp.]
MPSLKSSRSSIDQRFQFIVATIYVLMIPLVIWALANQWMAYAKARDALRDFETFRMTLDVLLDLSAERTAAFTALEDNAPTFTERQAKLAETRRTVDDDLAALRARLETTACEPCGDLVAAADRAQSQLQDARRLINASVGAQPADRSVDQINNAMDDLADVTPQVNSIAASLAPGIIQRDAYAVRYLYVAGFTALLRDNASLLGSQISEALTTGRPLSSDENLRIEQIMGKINQLYTLVRSTM